jgi:hypothetical protein
VHRHRWDTDYNDIVLPILPDKYSLAGLQLLVGPQNEPKFRARRHILLAIFIEQIEEWESYLRVRFVVLLTHS